MGGGDDRRWRRLKVGTNFVPEYLHSDHLGTLLQTTDASGTSSGSDVYTAFGERILGTYDRFGYLGEDGVQANEAFPFLFDEGRYYDPASDRYLQRSSGGIAEDLNVFVFGGPGLIDLIPVAVLAAAGPEKGRGDDPLYDKTPSELEKLKEEAKKQGDKKTVQKITKIEKHKEVRNVAKRVGKKLGKKIIGKIVPVVGGGIFVYD